uniref:YggT family protein n=1 Tax=Heterorhabditis bacteriophora TaxID=37862 RepID=A0A1I7WGA2_HETBA
MNSADYQDILGHRIIPYFPLYRLLIEMVVVLIISYLLRTLIVVFFCHKHIL